MSGWIKIHRTIQDHPLWKCEPFTRGQAWIDLILLANHKESFFYKRNIKINLDRGQVGRSEVELADRWKWSRSKVRKFLNDLENEQQIEQHKTNVTQLITIINYDEYQQKEQQDVQQKNSKKTAVEQQDVQQQDIYKNVKKEKNVKNIDVRENEFKIKVLECTKYSKEILNDFFNYWSQHGEKDKKMLFEKKPSFEIGKRLATWNRNNKKYSDEKQNLQVGQKEKGLHNNQGNFTRGQGSNIPSGNNKTIWSE